MLTAVIFLPSAGLALGKDFAECRFLALGKEIFVDKIFAERPLHSAKPLPSAWLALPSAPSTRQRGRLQWWLKLCVVLGQR